MEASRRQFLKQLLFGAGGLGLRSLATGLPIALLADPRRALAAVGPATRPTAAQFVILATSSDGDPIGCNVPGTYLDPRLLHPRAPSMAATTFRLGDHSVTAAKPWARLPQPLLNRTSFFHHSTATVVHSDEQKTLRLGVEAGSGGMFPSLLAARLGPLLGTVQPEPLVLGPRFASEALVYEDRPQPIVAPSALARFLSAPAGPLSRFTELRDRDLNRINAFIKESGNKAQARFVDEYVQSQTQLRALSDNLLSVLEGIQDDGPDAQVLAAVTLIRMKVAPVVSVHIPFGGDNHGDKNLAKETEETVSGVATLGRLWSHLVAAGLQDRVSFLSLNVFGRPLSPPNQDGRDHNGNHNTAIMFGRPFRGSVVGGVTPMDNDYGATSIDSKTGRSVLREGGDIRFADTLGAMAHTFARGVGVEAADLGPRIAGLRYVRSALAGG